MNNFHPNKTVAVFGGSGFLGRYVIQNLASLGVRVRVISRSIQDVRPVLSMGCVGQISYVQETNLLTPQAMVRSLKGCKGVVNLIGILYEKKGSTFQKVHAELPAHLGIWAHRLGISKLVHVSALGADITSNSDYARTKAQGDASLLSAFPKATLLRPSVIFGPEDHFLNRFATMACLGHVIPVIGAKTRFQPVYVDDIAKAVVASLLSENLQGTVYELGGPDILTFKALIERLLTWIHRRALILNIPGPLASAIGVLGGLLPNPPVTLDQVKLLQKDNIVAPHAKGFKSMGLTCRSLEAMAPGYLERFYPKF